MTNTRTARRSLGFTLIELLVVIGIIAVLLVITAGAVFRVLASQTVGATQTTLRKLHTGLTQQIQAETDNAEQTFRAGKVDQYIAAGTNRDAAKQSYVASVMQLEFPTSYAEVNVIAPATRPWGLQNKVAYQRNVALAPGVNAQEQASVCLYMALTQARRGMEFKLEDSVGVSSVRTIGGAKYIVDSWGTPIVYSRGSGVVRPTIISAGADKTFGTGDDISSDQLR
jgi:prepilin-type N-terminal cleavage/methylation domain-containing protein